MQMNYQSRKYAMLNRPIEVDRHLGRVRRYLTPRAADRILDVGCGRGFLTRQVQRFAPATIGIDVNEEAVANGVTDATQHGEAQIGMLKLGMEPAAMSPIAFREILRQDLEHWGPIVKASGFTAED